MALLTSSFFTPAVEQTTSCDLPGTTFAPRAESSASSGINSTTPSSTTSTLSSTSQSPIFPDPSSVTAVPDPNSTDTNNPLAKTVVEYAVLAVCLVIIACLLIQRYFRLRHNREPLSRFFALNSYPPSTPYRYNQQRFPRTNGLSSIPPYPYATRTSAFDTDITGRRLGGSRVTDHNGFLNDKDVLPAYDNTGGPPKYGEIEMMPPRSASDNAREDAAAGTSSYWVGAIVPRTELDARLRREESSHPEHEANEVDSTPSVLQQNTNAIQAPEAVYVSSRRQSE